MKKVILLILFMIISINLYAIVDEIKIFYYGDSLYIYRTHFTFQKGNDSLRITYSHVLVESAKFQYINSYFRDGYYYFLFFASSRYMPSGSSGRGAGAAGYINTAFIIKIDEDFKNYELINQDLTDYDPLEYQMSMYRVKKNGTVFYFTIEGRWINNDKAIFSFPVTIRVDADNLENGFFIIDNRNYDLFRERIQNSEDITDDENYVFNWR
jgi:hypothetical protein